MASKKTAPSKVGKAASQKNFYTAQRIKAEKSGDTKTTNKIYEKLNKAKYGKSSLVNKDSSYTAAGAKEQYNPTKAAKPAAKKKK